MYSMHVNVVVQAWLQYIPALSPPTPHQPTPPTPLNPEPVESWRNLLIVS